MKIFFVQVFLVLVFLTRLCWAHPLDSALQSLSKSIEWAGELPTQYMQEENYSNLLMSKNSLEAFIHSGHSSEVSGFSIAEAEIFLEVIRESLAYQDGIKELWGAKSTFSLDVGEAQKFLYREQVAYREKLISHFVSLFSLDEVSSYSARIFSIYFWEALVLRPRGEYSLGYMEEMKVDLDSWLDLTRLVLNRVRSSQNEDLKKVFYKDFLDMFDEGLLEAVVFQRELLGFFSLLPQGYFDSLRNYAVVKSYIERQGLAFQDPLLAMRVESFFSEGVREAYKALNLLAEPPELRAFLQKPFPRNPFVLVDRLDAVLKDYEVVVTEEDLRLRAREISESGVSDDIIAYFEFFRREKLLKPYYEHIILMRDFTVMTLRAENPQVFRSGEGESSDFQISDFMRLDYIIEGFKSSILSLSLSRAHSEVMQKAFAEFIPLIIELGGIEPSAEAELFSFYMEMRLKQPHSIYLTFLAKHLMLRVSLSAKLRLSALSYYESSALKDEGGLSGGELKRMRAYLEAKVSEDLRGYVVVKDQYRRSEYVLAKKVEGDWFADREEAERAFSLLALTEGASALYRAPSCRKLL